MTSDFSEESRSTSAPIPTAEDVAELTGSRNFVIPGCSTEITATQGEKTIEDLLSLVFALASSNPGIQVDFWIGIPDPNSEPK